MFYITSTHPLYHISTGPVYAANVHHMQVWSFARHHGLDRSSYGKTWFVYESERDYRDSLD